MVIELPAYSGRATLCPKCGTSYMKTVYHGWGGQSEPPMPNGRKPPCYSYDIREHLCRLCGNCCYGFPEACVNVQNKKGSGNGD
jgi:hypothetical protein